MDTIKLIPWNDKEVNIPFPFAYDKSNELSQRIYIDSNELDKYPDKDYCDNIYIDMTGLIDTRFSNSDAEIIKKIVKKINGRTYLRLLEAR